MIMPPCKENGVDCSDRTVGCQSTCPKMSAYYAKLEAAKKKERDHKRIDSYCKEAASRLKKSNGCVPLAILKEKLRSQERRANPYGKVIKKDKPAGGSTGG